MVRIIKPCVEVITPIDGEQILKHLEVCGRTCYKSADKITPESARIFINNLVKMRHESVLEHFSITVRFTCDIGVYKDLTRHRIASFSIESTRYCNYSKGKFGSELKVIEPCHIKKDSPEYAIWLETMEYIEKQYIKMSEMEGVRPDQLRMILPHSTAAEVCMTANIREWRHVFALRCAKAAHPSVQEVTKMLLKIFHAKIPVLFDDLYEQFFTEEEV